MITKIRGEQPFQVLASNFSISPSNEGYTLQISADGENYSNLFSVGANVTRMVTGVANGSYYRLSGNSSEVEINWRKQCSTGGGDADLSNYYTKAETDSAIENAMSGVSVDLSDYYTSAQTENAIQSAITAIDLSSFVTSGEVETQILAKDYATQSQIPDVSSFVTSAQVESQIVSKNYVTSGYVENAIASIDIPDVSSIEEHISTVEQVTAKALNELKGEISGITIPDVSEFVTSGDVETQITSKNFITSADTVDFITSADVSSFVTSAQVESQIVSKNFVTSADTASQISNSLSGYSTTQQMNTAINSAVANKVSSTTITTILSISQADYDALTVKDPNTLYLISNTVS